ncbi:SIMPL domain-containing protein [Ruminococcus sp.]|uniref:SIMPL domain-containing protein n=1 Tax=Ruminococcus sp. TaxID=41978 RepID=UPI0026005AB0|nr:SIMPL domain-containing protein [Ruminococcus sp.]MBQ8967811.1 SIMPL domain-containing protein [Ruminococcus sp.]
MSRLSVKGTAEMKFDVDIIKLKTVVSATADSSGEAVLVGKDKTEKFLSAMKEKLGIGPESFRLEEETVRADYSMKNKYNYYKGLTLEIKADMAALSKITAVIGEFGDSSYNVEFDISDMAEKEKQVIGAAVENSRAKAECIAASLGKTVQGVDDVKFDTEYEEPYRGELRGISADLSVNMEALVQVPKKSVSKSVTIDWIVE